MKSYERVGVLGVGAMGRHIAYRAYAAGHKVTLTDVNAEALNRAQEWILSFGQANGVSPAADRLSAVVSTIAHPLAVPQDLIIEAVPEDLELKVGALRALAEVQPEHTVLASNTSTLDIRDLASAVDSRAGKVVGLHFFNPASVMKLVEIPEMPGVEPALLEELSGLMRRWGMVPLVCPPEPGYIVNRVARPFYLEAQRALEETDLTPSEIDALVRQDLGYKWGPLEVTDFVGHDVNLAVSTYAWEIAGHDPRLEPSEAQRKLVAAGKLGRKSGEGFYSYDEDGHKTATSVDPLRLHHARAHPVGNVPMRIAVQVISEGVAMAERDGLEPHVIDTAMKLGANWPRGPFEFLSNMGPERVTAALSELQELLVADRYRVEPQLLGWTKN